MAKEYARTITGVVSTGSSYLDIDSKNLEMLIVSAVGENRTFAGTISIVITDLTEDSGAPAQPLQKEAEG